MKARWVVALGLSVALVLAVGLLMRDDAPRVDVTAAGAPSPSIDDTGTVEQAAPVTAAASGGTPDSTSSAFVDAKVADECKATLADATAFAEMELNAEFPLNPEEEQERYRVELEELPLRLIGSSNPESI